LVHVTVVPAGTVTVPGENSKSMIEIAVAAGAMGVPGEAEEGEACAPPPAAGPLEGTVIGIGGAGGREAIGIAPV
jgi:hypothetical protein